MDYYFYSNASFFVQIKHFNSLILSASASLIGCDYLVPKPVLVEAAAKACGDYEKKSAFREHARYWLEPDYEQSRQRFA